MAMEFEWDGQKSLRNLAERGFGFDDAIRIFAGRVFIWQDVRFAWGEDRFCAVGGIEGRFFTVVFTDRPTARRIISARRSRKLEIIRWQLSEPA